MRILNFSLRKSRMGICCSVVGLIVLALFLFQCGNISTSSLLFAQNNNNSNNNNSDNNDNNDDEDNEDDEDLQDDLRRMRWGYRQAVGGFLIDAEQAFRQATQEEISFLSDSIRSKLEAIPVELDQPCESRKISLRRLNDVLIKSAQSEAPLPDSVRYLGGLTGIDYIVAVPEENDIYLVGPAEGWTVDNTGTVVGKESGSPVLLLEDLLTVFRSWNTETPELISCSIDPTQEAVIRMNELQPIADISFMEQANKDAMGLMEIRFSGIPAGSRMAKVLAAADYRMKQLSLGFDQSSLKQFPSYFSMINGKNKAGYGQRFWISPEYQTIYHDSDQLVWGVADAQVNTLTERAYFSQNGQAKSSAKKDVAAEKWAKNMSNRYAELSKVEPIFAEAKNCMNIALIVALIYYQNLSAKAHCSLDALTDPDVLALPNDSVPKNVPSDSLVRKSGSRGYVAVTGGILINPWDTVKDNVQTDVKLDNMKNLFVFAGNHFWSN
ncbi:MAG: DUF1598 domain-containing protein [Planctomycetia bacterium]|nr:DUF1598 domain-containing protein [Planctomycetia bacterium]